MSKTNFTSTELIKIIKQCGESGISEFAYQGIKIKIDTPTTPYKRQDNYVDEPYELNDIPAQELAENFKDDDEVALSNTLEHLTVIDPVAAEALELKQFNKEA